RPGPARRRSSGPRSPGCWRRSRSPSAWPSGAGGTPCRGGASSTTYSASNREPGGPARLVRRDRRVVAQRQPDVVEPFEQPVAREVVERERGLDPGGRRGNGAPLDVDRELERRVGDDGIEQAAPDRGVDLLGEEA